MNEPSASQIQEALDRVLASPGFQSSGRMSSFLRFVVQHTLSGNDSPLKEFLIAQHVFGRDESFDPRTDTIVRVEARRLRSKLEKYYAHEGRNDPVVIHLAPRGYMPVFRTVGRISDHAPHVRPRSRLVWAIAAAVALCAAGSAAWLFLPRSSETNFTHSVAVLPCVNTSSDPEVEALANGLSNDIVSLLGHVATLRVVSHGTSPQTNNGRADAVAAGRSLSVDVVLECAVRTDLTQYRVSARLFDAKDGLPVWTDEFERKFDTARSPTEISRSIVTGLEITLTPSVDARLRPATESPEASRHYSIGRHHWSRAMGTMQREHFDNAIRSMEQAIGADSRFAAAHAGLADALGALAGSGLDHDPEKTFANAFRAARKAIELDPNLAESQLAMAALYAAEGNWPGCDRHFLRAIALKPSLATAHQAYAVLCLSPQQRYVEAVSRLRRAIEIEPTWAEAHVFLAQTLVYSGQTDDALTEIDKALQLQPDYVVAEVVAALAHLSAGKHVEAIRALNDIGPAVRELPYCQGLLGYALARLGDRKGATKALEGLLAHQQQLLEVDIAGVHNGLGDVEAALGWLEKAHARAKAGIAYVIDDPRFRSLGSNPRFVSLLRQMGLPIT